MASSTTATNRRASEIPRWKRLGDSNLTFRQVPEAPPLQARAYELLSLFSVAGK
jgi:hypothetical protein